MKNEWREKNVLTPNRDNGQFYSYLPTRSRGLSTIRIIKTKFKNRLGLGDKYEFIDLNLVAN